jgi:hypothetical protein
MALPSAATEHAPAVALLSANQAVGLLRAAGSPGTLRFTLWNGSSWTALAEVASQVTTRAAPSITAGSTTAHALFHGDDFMHYYAAYGSSWQPIDEPVAAPSMPQSYGPRPARVTMLGSDVAAAYAGDDGQLYLQLRSAGVWQPAEPVTGSAILQAPGIAALGGSPELMAVYAHHAPSQPDDKKLFWASRSGGVWSSPEKISDAVFTDDPVSLTALGGGEALVGYRGTDGLVYALRYTPGGNPAWSAPLGIANPNPAAASAPSVAPGIDGHDAEIAWIDAGDGSVYHSSLNGSTWSAPAAVGGTQLHSLALAGRP